jgi:hypothetical protein
MQGQFRGWTDEYNFDVEAGPDVTITRWLTDRAGFELRYFGSMQWEDEQTWQTGQWWIIATKPFISAFQLSGVATGSPLSSRYASQLHSTEVNYREAPNQTISYLVGFRWIELHEDLHLAADTGNNPTELDWDVDNHLYGGQLGAEINVFDRGGPTSALVWFKGGVYGNDANNDFTHLRAPAYGNVSRDNRKGQLAFVGDIALTGSCQLTRHVALRGGYQMLLAQGVALGSENLAATNPYTGVGIDASGFVFYHGALASVDFAW